jgi:outer membrane protein insertion porin family
MREKKTWHKNFFLFLLSVFLFCFLSSPSFSSEKIKILKVEYKGLRNIKKETIQEKSSIELNKEYSVEKKGKNKFYNPTFEKERERILNLGFFKNVKYKIKKKESILVFKISEYPILKEVDLIGNSFVDSDVILEDFPLKKEDVFNKNKIKELKESIKRIYDDYGYSGVLKEYRISKDGTLTLKIKEGKIKEIAISGNELTKAEDILLNILSQPGKFYSKERVKEDVKRLKDLDWFKDISYEYKFDEEGDATITFKVSEKWEKLTTAVDIKGLTVLPKEFVLNLLNIKQGEILSYEKIQKDIDLITTLGFFHEVKPKFSSYLKGTKVTYYVKENPKIEEINFKGNTIFSENVLRKILRTKKGEVVNFNLLSEDVKRIEDFYREKGYIVMRIYDDLIDEIKKNGNKLTIFIGEGIIEEIKIEGEKEEIIQTPEGEKVSIVSTKLHTKNYVILREMKTKVGKVLNFKVLRRDLERIYNLGFFEDVRQKIQPGTKSEDSIILILKIRERKTTGTALVGAGYSSVYGMTGNASITKNNLFGKGRSLSLNTQFGGINSYSIKYFEPWIDRKHTSISIFLFNTFYRKSNLISNTISSYNEKNKGFSINMSRPFKGEDIKLNFSIEAKDVEITNLSGQQCGLLNGQVRNFSLGLTKDTRNNIFNATRGVYDSINFGFSGGFAGGDINFFKFSQDERRYFKVKKEDIIYATRFLFGYYNGDNLCSELFSVGGAETIRGYPDYYFYGTRFFVLNNELRFAFTKGLTTAVFVDSGYAWPEGIKFSFSDLKTTLGMGIRYTLPGLGPIRIDWGYALKEKQSQLHLSFGQMF